MKLATLFMLTAMGSKDQFIKSAKPKSSTGVNLRNRPMILLESQRMKVKSIKLPINPNRKITRSKVIMNTERKQLLLFTRVVLKT